MSHALVERVIAIFHGDGINSVPLGVLGVSPFLTTVDRTLDVGIQGGVQACPLVQFLEIRTVLVLVNLPVVRSNDVRFLSLRS